MINQPTKFILHHTAVSYVKNPNQLKATNQYHKDKGFNKSELGYYTGYHYEISAAGVVTQTRKIEEEGCHTIGENTSSIGICLDGDFDNEQPTSAQVASLKALLLQLSDQYAIYNVFPHRKYANKTCYGSLLSDTWGQDIIRSSVLQKIQEKIQWLTEQIANIFKRSDKMK